MVCYHLTLSIDIMETWKIHNVGNYPIELWPNEQNRQSNVREVSTTSIRVWKEDSSKKTGKFCFVIDAARIWKQLPTEIKVPKTIN